MSMYNYQQIINDTAKEFQEEYNSLEIGRARITLSALIVKTLPILNGPRTLSVEEQQLATKLAKQLNDKEMLFPIDKAWLQICHIQYN